MQSKVGCCWSVEGGEGLAEVGSGPMGHVGTWALRGNSMLKKVSGHLCHYGYYGPMCTVEQSMCLPTKHRLEGNR